MDSKAYELDCRDAGDIERSIVDAAPHYTPEWAAADPDDPGVALLKIFSRLTGAVIDRLNRAPYKNFVAFLDMLGITLVPATPARAPLAFSLVKDATETLVIPARTQVGAGKTAAHGELTFETEKELLAIPGRLKSVLCAVPAADAIYRAPAGFPGDGPVSGSLTYTILSASAAGSRYLQLDHADGLSPGDFLCIGDDREYAAIESISDVIIRLGKGLAGAYPAGTIAEKQTRLPLTEGWNQQEHALYLGHADLFNVKSPARFTAYLTVTRGAGGEAPPDLSWEYWGEVEKVSGWYPFDVDDATDGMRRSGTVGLAKTTEGEIKEQVFFGVKSRWIRCIVNNPLGTEEARVLPVLDRLMLSVASSDKLVKPDLAFDDDTPLDVGKAFLPFGKEPRTFEAFAIGSKETFSKKGAKVTMNLTVESRGITGGPAALKVGDNLNIYARGTYGRLMEIVVYLAGSKPSVDWFDRGFPGRSTIASGSAPGVIQYRYSQNQCVSVFVRGEDGCLYEWLYNGSQGMWLSHPDPDVNVASDPVAICYSPTGSTAKLIACFVRGSNGRLYEFYRAPNNPVGTWIEHGQPHDVSFTGHPYVYQEKAASDIILVSMIDSDGKLHALRYKVTSLYSAYGSDWRDFDKPSAAKLVSRPIAVFNGDAIRAYARDSENLLWKLSCSLYSYDPSDWESIYPVGYKGIGFADSDPVGRISIGDDGATKSVSLFVRFVKAAPGVNDKLDGSIWEYRAHPVWSGWYHHYVPGTTKPLLTPFWLEKHVLSLSDKNSVLELIYKSSSDIWNEYKDPEEKILTPLLSWEYYNKENGWVLLPGVDDGTSNLLTGGDVVFRVPEDIAETAIAGQKSYWIRARIVGGDYGRETYSLVPGKDNVTVAEATRDRIRPPLINEITLAYAFDDSMFPQHCLAHNNLACLDQGEANRQDGTFFLPFLCQDDRTNTLYLGFDRPFEGGPIRIFFGARELKYTAADRPKVLWSYLGADGWKPLSVLDGTEALIKSEILELLMPPDLAERSLFGEYRCWIRAGHAGGRYDEPPVIDGIWPNATWAIQAETFRDEILGSGDGRAGQAFSFLHRPVLPGEEIRVRETLTEQERQALAQQSGEGAVQDVKDGNGRVTATSVRWSEVPDFSRSGSGDRHYVIDRALGRVCFGDGVKGMAPPPGDNDVVASVYQSGGGLQGNAGAGEIISLKTSVPGLDKVTNPVAADGGSDTATVEQMLATGPAMISHHGRAVSAVDYEWLARAASAKVARARCLPGRNNNGDLEPGWVTVVIVPDAPDPRPQPSLALRDIVRRYLESRCPAGLARAGHVRVTGPAYTRVGVAADVFVASLDVAAQAERAVKTQLEAFLHPLTGGPGNAGWDFGRSVSVSDIYALIEDTPGVDHVENLRLICEGTETELVPVPPAGLVANGEHSLEFKVRIGE